MGRYLACLRALDWQVSRKHERIKIKCHPIIDLPIVFDMCSSSFEMLTAEGMADKN